MRVRRRMLAGLAGQLGHPSGFWGHGVARLLNRGNRRAVAAAVEAAEVRLGETVADIGFGGGVGIPLLLDHVGAEGVVHGIEISTTMLARARRRFRGEIRAGRLWLSEGSLAELPLPGASLDAAVTTNTIYFVPELGRALGELTRVLRPGGRVVVGIGDPDGMAKLPITRYGFTLRPVAEVTAAMEAAGLTLTGHRRLAHATGGFHLLVAGRR